MKSALEQLQEIEAKAAKEIEAIEEKKRGQLESIKNSARLEIVQRMASLRNELKALEDDYEALTGKPVREKEQGKRTRLTQEQLEALSNQIKALLTKDSGKAMKDLVLATGAKESTIRKILGSLPLKTTGNRASTLYFAK